MPENKKSPGVIVIGMSKGNHWMKGSELDLFNRTVAEIDRKFIPCWPPEREAGGIFSQIRDEPAVWGKDITLEDLTDTIERILNKPELKFDVIRDDWTKVVQKIELSMRFPPPRENLKESFSFLPELPVLAFPPERTGKRGKITNYTKPKKRKKK